MRSLLCGLGLAITLLLPLRAAVPISEAGRRLLNQYEAMDVEKHWTAGVQVDWRTGEPTGKPVSEGHGHTHCSAFVAATCERLGVYILRPPQHSAALLASAQADWLLGEGASQGWKPVGTAAEAQDLANQGEIVVAVFRSDDPKKPGHVALVRPGLKDEALLAREGPDIIQAGAHNYLCASLKKGFAQHPGAFLNNKIHFFVHYL